MTENLVSVCLHWHWEICSMSSKNDWHPWANTYAHGMSWAIKEYLFMLSSSLKNKDTFSEQFATIVEIPLISFVLIICQNFQNYLSSHQGSTKVPLFQEKFTLSHQKWKATVTQIMNISEVLILYFLFCETLFFSYFPQHVHDNCCYCYSLFCIL